MATFHLIDPSGATYEVDAPDEHAAVSALGQMQGAGASQAAAQPAQPDAASAKDLSWSDHLTNIRDSLHGATRAIENGLTFGLADRARAGMGAIIGDGGYGDNLKAEQAADKQYSADHPIAAPVIEGIGGVATPLGAIGAASKGISLGAKTLLGMGAGAGLGGIQGAASSPDWTDVPQTAKDAGLGAGLGAVVGGAIPAAGKALGAAYNAGANALRGRADGMSRAASGHLTEALAADTPQAVQAKVASLGPQGMLADAGPAMLGKAQGASLNSDEGRSVLQGALTTRNEGTNQRIMGDVNRALGPAEDPQTVTNFIRDHRAAVDNVAYPAALTNAPEVKTAPILVQIDDMIPRSVGMEKKALTNLRDMMMATEKRPVLDSQGFPQYDNLGRQKFQDVKVSQNDASVLHKVKQELDNVIEYDAPGLGVPAGALTRQQGILKHMRGQVNDALETQVPGYLEANRQSAALARRGQSVDLGTQYLGAGKTTASPDRFAAEFSRLEPGEQIAFAKGSRGNIERALGTKANDLQALKSELQGEGGWNTAKLTTVHGQPAADELVSSVDRNLQFRNTHNKVVENSQTAQRTAAANAMKPSPSTETPLINPNMSLAGLLSTGAKKAVGATYNALTKTDPAKNFGEIATILSAQGPQRDRHLQALVDALGRRDNNAATSTAVGNRAALIAALAANGYSNNRMRTRQ